MTKQALTHPILFYDGACKFCDASVNRIIKIDREARIHFAALQSDIARQHLRDRPELIKDMQSLVFLDKGKIYDRTDAILQIANYLPFKWKWIKIMHLFPKRIRDYAYQLIARNRYKWFGVKNKCLIPTPDIKNRFIDI